MAKSENSTEQPASLDLLKSLCMTPGIPSREDAVRDIVIDAIRPLTDAISVDAMGNVIATRMGDGGPSVMIAAHMDEIGFIVKHIDDAGFIRLQSLGGFDSRVLLAQRVQIQTQSGESVPGVLQFSAKPIHLLDASEIKPPKLDDLFVDTGMSADAVKETISLGDMVTMEREFVEMGDCVVTKALDDRLGVFVMIEAIRKSGKTAADVFAVATTQEEVGLRGAKTSGYAVEPDISIALDITLAMDIPESKPDSYVTTIGNGVAIKIMDSSHIGHPKLVQHMRDIATAEGIPFQMEILPRGGTDAGATQLAGRGSVAITLSIPCRYVHTVNEMASRSDIQATIDLLAAYLRAAGDRSYSY